MYINNYIMYLIINFVCGYQINLMF